ncbi:hypothetical protein IFM89_019030 [Coptis chinensis]|uniref:PRA1 family protein n=1 Tax=Coptis chinensis TaxID=261450 RepID=A0A835LJ46_9MAGN|nr:hypothetical protein IFM89_019030 [Coptis chinensis]
MASQIPQPLLPISNTETTAMSSEQQTITTTKLFIARLTESTRLAFSQRRPWTELLDRSAFTRPESITDAASRIKKNSSYFRINYLTIITTILAVSLLTHPFSLLTLLCLLSAWMFLYVFRPSDQPLIIFNRTFTDRETLMGLIGLSIVVVFLTSVGAILMGGILVGLGVVCGHGAFRVPEDLFLDDQDSGNAGGVGGVATGLLSFIAPSPAAVVAARV